MYCFFLKRFCKDQSACEQWWPGINSTQKLELEKPKKMKELGWRLVLRRAPCRRARLQQPLASIGDREWSPSPPAHLGEEQELKKNRPFFSEEMCQLK